MTNYFFDCGTHMFQGFGDFSSRYNIDSSWKCYCFEANPITYSESKVVYDKLSLTYDIEHLNCAISNTDGVATIKCPKVKSYGFQVEPGIFADQVSNILDTPLEYWNNEYQEHDIKAIDFSKFLKDTVTEDDYVLIKMDIEGSEFSVLDKIIEDENINLIDEIYVEFHERHFADQNYYKQKKEEYMKIFSKKGIKLTEWI